MKLLEIVPIGVRLELDATDCLVLADALACAAYRDATPDRNLAQALRCALEFGAAAAATATLRDSNTPEARMLAGTRRVWGPFDAAVPARPRMTERPA